ncbi:MAG: hypothetical protein RIQ46_1382, partial [Pseudomonadota bacterium]
MQSGMSTGAAMSRAAMIGLVVLLFTGNALNYVDRQVLAL